MEAATDLSAAAVALQVDLLQLPPEIPTPGVPALRDVLDRLFAHWLNLPTPSRWPAASYRRPRRAVRVRTGRHGECDATVDAAARGRLRVTALADVAVPREEGQRGGRWPAQPLRIPAPANCRMHHQGGHTVDGRPPLYELKKQCISLVDQLFAGHSNGLGIQDGYQGTLPTTVVLYHCSFGNINKENTGFVKRDAFMDFWVNSNMMIMDSATQVFTILKQQNHDYLTKKDFKSILRDLLDNHPGLEFLKSTPKFQ